MDISTIIVNYQAREKTFRCLESVRKANLANPDHEAIVIDNGSPDNIENEIKRYYPDIIFLRSEKNLGMGGGNNLGIRKAKGRYFLILNMDTRLEPNTVKILHEYLEANPSVGIVAPELVFADGGHQDSCFRFPNLWYPLVRRTFVGRIFKSQVDSFLMKDASKRSPIDADWVMGSVLLIRREAMDAAGGPFDERFFMYFEDTDLCRRIWQAGYKVVYYPLVRVVHDHSRESAKYPWYIAPFKNKLARIHISSWVKYVWKWR